MISWLIPLLSKLANIADERSLTMTIKLSFLDKCVKRGDASREGCGCWPVMLRGTVRALLWPASPPRCHVTPCHVSRGAWHNTLVVTREPVWLSLLCLLFLDQVNPLRFNRFCQVDEKTHNLTAECLSVYQILRRTFKIKMTTNLGFLHWYMNGF